MQRLIHYLKDYKKQVILGPLFKLIEAISELLLPLMMARIIDFGVNTGNLSYVFKVGGLMLLFSTIGLIFALICQYYAAEASQGFGTNLRNAVFTHINRLSYQDLDRFTVPSLITRTTDDISKLQLAVAMMIRLVVRIPFLVIGAIVMAMMIDLKLSLIFFVSSLAIALTLSLIIGGSVPYFKKIQKGLDRLSLLSRETLGGNRVVRAFSKQKEEIEEFSHASDSVSTLLVTVGRISALLNPATYLLINGSIVAILWFGASRVNSGAILQGEMIALVGYMTQILLALVVAANLVVIFTRAWASAARVNEVLDVEPSISVWQNLDPNSSTKQLHDISVAFDHVSFSYGGDSENAIEDITFEVSKGSTVGVIGGVGSGKSTLINLIPRFYDATGGSVLVDGVNVKKYPVKELRNKIGVVPQKALLFSGTIEENLRWGKQDATDEEIKDALTISQSLEFIKKLPHGIHTKLEQGGKNLSGGQRQRLTIARALIKQPSILILDDSTSALDYLSDLAFRRALHRETAHITVFIVSQRTSSLMDADQIIVLDDGKIDAIGTHDELLTASSLYREIYLSQQSRDQEPSA